MDLSPTITWTCLESRVFQWGLFQGFKGSLCLLVQYQGKVPGGDAPPNLGSVAVETIQETGEVLIFADINGVVFQLVNNSWFKAITGAGLQLPVLNKYRRKSAMAFRGGPQKSTWLLRHQYFSYNYHFSLEKFPTCTKTLHITKFMA